MKRWILVVAAVLLVGTAVLVVEAVDKPAATGSGSIFRLPEGWNEMKTAEREAWADVSADSLYAELSPEWRITWDKASVALRAGWVENMRDFRRTQIDGPGPEVQDKSRAVDTIQYDTGVRGPAPSLDTSGVTFVGNFFDVDNQGSPLTSGTVTSLGVSLSNWGAAGPTVVVALANSTTGTGAGAVQMAGLVAPGFLDTGLAPLRTAANTAAAAMTFQADGNFWVGIGAQGTDLILAGADDNLRATTGLGTQNLGTHFAVMNVHTTNGLLTNVAGPPGSTKNLVLRVHGDIRVPVELMHFTIK